MNLEFLTAIVPALNEEETIGTVVADLRRAGVTTVLVVDNGSTDQTALEARQAGGRVITEPVRGYGRACLTGIAHLAPETQWVLFCDADGSDDLGELPRLFEAAEDCDLVLGNRRATTEGRRHLTAAQNFGNGLSGFLLKMGWGKGFADLGPLRLIKRLALTELEMQDQSFGWTVEMQAKALEKGLRCVEVPVNYRPRQGGESKISGTLRGSVQAGHLILKTIGSLWLQRPVVQRVAMILALLFLALGAFIMSQGGDPAHAEKGAVFFGSVALLAAGFLIGAVYKGWSLKVLFGAAVGTRLLLLAGPPGDDIWRYLWEGMIQLKGYSPYQFSPDDPALALLRTPWWEGINNKEYTAIYPPLTQLVFRGLAFFSPSVLLFKGVFGLADLACGWLLWRRFGARAYWYLLNPLVLYSFAGGGHYDSLFLLPLVAGWLEWERAGTRRIGLIGGYIGLSASFKLVPLLAAAYFAGALLRECWQGRANFAQSTARAGRFMGGLFCVPLLSGAFFSMLSGVPPQLAPLEFSEIARTTSFLPWICEFFNEGFFPVPNQFFLLPFGLCLAGLLLGETRFAPYLLSAYYALLLCSPMVHAWYITWLLPFAAVYQRPVIIAFSFTAFLYFLQPFRLASGEQWGLTGLERLVFWSPLLGWLGLRMGTGLLRFSSFLKSAWSKG